MKTEKSIYVILPHLGGGGAERLHMNLANDWSERGFNVHLILLKKTGKLLNLVAPDVKLIDLNVERIYQMIIPLIKIFYSKRPDVVLSAMWPITSVTVLSWFLSGRLCKLFLVDHIPIIGFYAIDLNINLRWVKIIMRLTYNITNGIIAVSTGVKNDIIRLTGIKSTAVKVIYNPVIIKASDKQISDSIGNSIWGKSNHRILGVGRFKSQKNFETLIKAFSLLPKNSKAKLIILGEGDERSKLENLINKLNIQSSVLLPGFKIDPSPWFKTANLFVNSSKYDGLPLVIIEALSFGLPVVSTDCISGPSEILMNGLYGDLFTV